MIELNSIKKKVKRWTLKQQQKYTNNFKNFLKKNNIGNNNYYRIQIKNINLDKRILIGSLKYIPYVIFCLLKTIPMPWEKSKTISIIRHISDSLIISKDQNYTFELLFLSQWSTLWMMTKKFKIYRKNFVKVRFPITDDEEFLDKSEQFFIGELSLPLIVDKYPHNIHIVKNWFYEYQKTFAFFLKKQFKNYFFIDNLTYLVLIRLTKRSNLFFLLLHNNESIFSFIKFWCSLFYDFKSRNRNNNSLFRNLISSKNNLIEFNKSQYPFLYNLPFNYLVLTRKFFKKQFFLNNNINSIKYKKYSNLLTPDLVIKNFNRIILKKNVLNKKNENNIYPFFKDIFLSTRRVSFIFKLGNCNLQNILEKQYIKPSYKIPFINKISIPDMYCDDLKLISNHFVILKNYINKISKKNRKFNNSFSLYKLFDKNIFFVRHITEWIEMGLHICSQSHKTMTLLLGRKNLVFLYLDFNFNLKPIRTLTTKERKKSRFSNSFHFCREILRFVKMLVDIHVQFRIGNINEYQLADGISYIFTHMGHLTGIYRYKYKTIYQIRVCKSIQKILYKKLNKNKKSIAFGFWAPFWRVWLFFMRGVSPVLQRWLSNLVSRHFFGRIKSKKTLQLTKQRINTYYDIELKKILLNEFEKITKKTSNKNCTKIFTRTINKAWKCWKANLPWTKNNISFQYQKLIIKYLKVKSEWYIQTTFIDREKIRRGSKIDKILIKKNTGKMTRLWFRAEQNRQMNYIEKGPYILFSEILQAFNIFSEWLNLIRFPLISLPCFSQKSDLKLLVLSVENIRENNLHLGINSGKFNNESKKLENILNNPYLTLKSIKEKILTDRNFSEIGISFLDNFYSLIPIYFLEIEEKITDNFLDQYLWLESIKRNFFPDWIKPSDSEINPFSTYKYSSFLCPNLNIKNICLKKNFCVINIKCIQAWENIDFSFLKKILLAILDENLIEYVISKNNVKLYYKDMFYLNSIGLIRGLAFSGFLLQIYLLITDLFLLGIDTAKRIYFQKILKNNNVPTFAKDIPILFYFRYISKILFLLSLSKKNLLFVNDNHFSFTLKRRVPTGVCKIIFTNNIKNNNKSDEGPFDIFVDLCGFKIYLKNFVKKRQKIWFLKKNIQKKKFKYIIPFISFDVIKELENRIKQFLITYNSTTFTKISNKWNLNLIGFVSYYRESCLNCHNFFKLVSHLEEKIQVKIKISLNSKMPSRFPPVLFYAPRELGGLGMLSISNPFIPDTDLRYSLNNHIRNNESFYERFKIQLIPSLLNYLFDWEYEFLESRKIWTEYLVRKFQNNKNLSFEDLRDLWDKGIPRINTLFQKDRHSLAFDHGWRIRFDMKKYKCLKFDPFWWTNIKHDGKLWSLNKYRKDIIQILGGVENILEHTLFKGTYFSSWEGLFWEKISGFEQFYKTKNLSNAQRYGLNQIPNRRFVLWWSTTINRGNVYIGFRIQLDLTGIFMYGKIPTLKISLIQIFRSHLWQKIHESVTIDISKNLDKNMELLDILTIQKELIHPRKSYKLNSSCADIVFYSTSKWKIEPPSLLIDNPNYISKKLMIFSDKFWLDIQLRWGDFDSHDIERYSRTKFLEYTSDLQSIYPCITGAIISIDLAYNIFSGYGYWYKKFRLFIYKSVLTIIKINPSLFILRERIRRSLQLFIYEPKEVFLNSENYISIFNKKGTWLLDDSCFYRVSLHQSVEGNVIIKPTNGVLFIFSPENGKMFFRIIHKTFWQGHRRLSQLAKWKSAEEVVKLINYVSQEQKPNEIIVLKKNMIQPLIAHMIDFPNIIIKGSLIKIPFQSIIKLTRIKKMFDNSIYNNLLIFNVYDDWLESISSFTAFSRLLLILKALKINFEEVQTIFNQFRQSDKENNNYFWPNISDRKWVKLEIILKDIIVDNYCYRKKLNPNNLSQNDIRLIILGFSLNLIYKPGLVRYHNSILSHSLNITPTTDISGRNLLVSISSKKEQEEFVSIKNWQFRSIFAEKKNLLLKNLKIEYCFSNSNDFLFIVPRNIFKHFLSISNPMCQIISLMFGFIKNEHVKLHEIRILLIPSQMFKNNVLTVNVGSIKNNFLIKLEFFGFMISGYYEEFSFNKIRKIIPILNKISINKANSLKFTLIAINIGFYTCDVFGFQINYFDEKKRKNEEIKIQILLTNRVFGGFLVPVNRKWNYFFKPLIFDDLKPDIYVLDLPYSFFDYIHYL
nr:splicing factor Prp8 [Cryptomonas curvata]